jgi:hypothetical protein
MAPQPYRPSAVQRRRIGQRKRVASESASASVPAGIHFMRVESCGLTAVAVQHSGTNVPAARAMFASGGRIFRNAREGV